MHYTQPIMFQCRKLQFGCSLSYLAVSSVLESINSASSVIVGLAKSVLTSISALKTSRIFPINLAASNECLWAHRKRSEFKV